MFFVVLVSVLYTWLGIGGVAGLLFIDSRWRWVAVTVWVALWTLGFHFLRELI